MIQHLACIMDGNRRWAKAQGWLPWDGHKEGVKAAQRVVEYCLQKEIPYLSLYTFSLENFNRSEKEQSFLFTLFGRALTQVLSFAHENQVRVRIVGDRSRFPASLHASILRVEGETNVYNRLTVNVLFCYGGRHEIVAAAQKLAHKVELGQLRADEISEDVFTENTWLENIPEPNLLVRTGGARRLSNFLLYHMAYTEIYFLDTLWPAITDNELDQAVSYYRSCQKNGGA